MTARAKIDPAAWWRTTAFRLTALVTGLFVVASLLVVGAIYWSASQLLLQDVVDDVARRSAALRAELALAPDEDDRRIVAQRAKKIDAEGDGRFVLLVEPSTRRPLAGNLAMWPPGLRSEGRADVFEFGVDGRTRLAVGIGHRLPSGRELLVAATAQAQQRLTERLRWIVLSGGLVVILTGLAAGLLLGRLVMRRVAVFAATGERFMRGAVDERIPLDGSRDEFDQLAVALNRMFDRIARLMAGMREVSDNIAHDLKTPLNRLRIRAEQALAGPSDEAARREALAEILAETDEIIRTFNALLQVARLEAGALEPTGETFELSALLRDIVELYEPVAEDAGGALVLGAVEPLTIAAHRQLIGQAVTNLIENALKYGTGTGDDVREEPHGANVTVTLERTTEAIVLQVADRGPGIPERNRKSALERFVRLDQSRSKPGTGLGLSLAAAVARGHGGDIVLLDNAPGLAAQLRLPLDLVAQTRDGSETPQIPWPTTRPVNETA